MKKIIYKILTGSTSGITNQLPIFLEAAVDEMGIMVGFDGEMEQIEQFCNFTYRGSYPSPSRSSSVSPTRTPTPSQTPTRSISPTRTPSLSVSSTITPSLSIFPTPSITQSITPSTSMMIYYACMDYGLELTGVTGGNFLSAGTLISTSGSTIGDYVIEWRNGSTSGDISFISGIGSDVDIQSQHPFTDEVVLSGVLYPVIRYVYINGDVYNAYSSAGARFSPDLLTCLSTVTIDPITCSTVIGTDTLYPFYLTYNNITDYGADKSREFTFIISSGTTYLAWEFQAYYVSEQLKIYYCNSGETEGTLVDNWVHGYYYTGTTELVKNLYPIDYPNNPRITKYGETGYNPLVAISNLSGFTWSSGNYIRIQIIGSVYDPTNINTNWYIKLKCLTDEDMDCTFIFDNGVSTISTTPYMVYSGDPDCRYEVMYDTEDVATGITRSVQSTTLFKYLNFYSNLTYNPSGYSFITNPVKIGMRWRTEANSLATYWTAGINTCVNLSDGETISISKTTTGMTFTFTDIDDYNVYVNDIAAFKNDDDYKTWTGLTSTDHRYYAYFRIQHRIATSCGDDYTTHFFYFHWSCPIEYDEINKTITIEFVIPTNDYPDAGECNDVYETITSKINTLDATKNYTLPVDTTTHVRFEGIIYAIWPTIVVYTGTTIETYYHMSIDDVFVNGICDMSALGFCYNIPTGTTLWSISRYWDRLTFTDVTDHASRLANWRLERRTYLRTKDCNDLGWETVHEVP